MIGVKTLKRLVERVSFYILLKPRQLQPTSTNADERVEFYKKLAQDRKPGPFDHEYIDHENEG